MGTQVRAQYIASAQQEDKAMNYCMLHKSSKSMHGHNILQSTNNLLFWHILLQAKPISAKHQFLPVFDIPSNMEIFIVLGNFLMQKLTFVIRTFQNGTGMADIKAPNRIKVVPAQKAKKE